MKVNGKTLTDRQATRVIFLQKKKRAIVLEIEANEARSKKLMEQLMNASAELDFELKSYHEQLKGAEGNE